MNKTRDPAMTVNMSIRWCDILSNTVTLLHVTVFPGDGTVGVNECTEVTKDMPGLLQSTCDILHTRGISLTIKHS